MKKSILFLLFFIFISCTENSKSEQVEVSSETLTKLNTNSLKFVKEHIVLTEEIVKLINSQNNNTFNPDVLNKINDIKTTQDMELFFQRYGFENTEELVTLFKKQENNFSSFVKNNPEFLLLKMEDRKKLIKDDIANSFNIFDISNTNLVGKVVDLNSCESENNRRLKRCQRDYAINLGLSWVATVGTGGWGAVGFVAAVISYSNCESDSIEDYNICRGWDPKTGWHQNSNTELD